ncbi:MAG: heat-inducible transcriptional repressor HrcA [bacterium]|nr:heat-inducible transcriptional repressor HrcA [bacterium]
MDSRNQRILDCIIEQYIDTAEPIGSRAISKQLDLSLSAATIRNVMADLTEMGLLCQPHTSAGRIPTDLAYRYYVQKTVALLAQQPQKVDPQEASYTDEFARRYQRLEDVLQDAADELTASTHCTGLALGPRPSTSKLKRVELIGISQTQVLVVLVTQAGLVKNRIISFRECPNQEDLNKIAQILVDHFVGLGIGEIQESLLETLAAEAQELSAHAIRIGKKALELDATGEVFISGSANLCQYPEFSDHLNLQKVYQRIEDKGQLYQMMDELTQTEGLHIQIGDENQKFGLQSCSVLASTYGSHDNLLGSIGVIGPTRINYPRVIQAINRSSRKLSWAVGHFLSPDR